MNLIAAIKSGRPFRKRSWVRPDEGWLQYEAEYNRVSWTNRDGTFNFSASCVLADDWEIQEPTVTITRTQFLQTFAQALKFVEDRGGFRITNFSGHAAPPPLWESAVVQQMAQILGLEP